MDNANENQHVTCCSNKSILQASAIIGHNCFIPRELICLTIITLKHFLLGVLAPLRNGTISTINGELHPFQQQDTVCEVSYLLVVCSVNLNLQSDEHAFFRYKLATAGPEKWVIHLFYVIFFLLSYPITYFLFICFHIMTEIVDLTKIEVLPNPAHFHYSF